MKYSILFFACILIGLTSCKKNPQPLPANEVSIDYMSYSPATLAVPVGTTVTWVNNDKTAHTVTTDNAYFDSDDIAPGKSFSFTFKTSGTFNYHCKNQAVLQGTVIVK